jgi:F0F1-type ATP synthase membrane subunit c/vacuolar-type H+-ATPase subunit K
VNFEPQTWEFLGRYLGAGLALGFGGIGAAIGMGRAAASTNEAVSRQPQSHGTLLRTMLIGQAVGSSPSIFALVIGLLILFVPASTAVDAPTFAAALIGAGLSIGLGCFGSGVGCGWPADAACAGVARNPDRATPISSAMIIGQAVAQSPSIFATVIALILIFVPVTATSWAAFGICLGVGFAMGAGALGPGVGSGTTAGGAVHGMSRWPKTQAATLRTMLITQAVSQTPAIFGMLVAFIMLFALQDLENNIIGFAKTLAAGIAVGFGGIGPGIGSGLAGETACAATAARPRLDALMLRTVLIGQAVSQSTAIYALIIALVLLYVV